MFTIEDIMFAYTCGIDDGQLMMEQERDSEDLFDAFNCYRIAQKMCIPSAITRRRRPHSNEWREVKESSKIAFLKMINEKMSAV